MKRFGRDSSAAALSLAALILAGCSSEPAPTAETEVESSTVATEIADAPEQSVAVVEEVEPIAQVRSIEERPSRTERARTSVLPTVQNVSDAEAVAKFTPSLSASEVSPASVVAADPALVELAQLAAAGDVDAQFEMARANAHNVEVSNKWFLQAAANGHADAQAMMAMRYATGQGVQKDENEAARWLDLAEQAYGREESRRDNVIIARTAKPKWAPRKPMGFLPTLNQFDPNVEDDPATRENEQILADGRVPQGAPHPNFNFPPGFIPPNPRLVPAQQPAFGTSSSGIVFQASEFRSSEYYEMLERNSIIEDGLPEGSEQDRPRNEDGEIISPDGEDTDLEPEPSAIDPDTGLPFPPQ